MKAIVSYYIYGEEIYDYWWTVLQSIDSYAFIQLPAVKQSFCYKIYRYYDLA